MDFRPGGKVVKSTAVVPLRLGIDVGPPWTQEAARRWWSYHVPNVEPAMESLRPGPQSAARSLALHATSGRG